MTSRSPSAQRLFVLRLVTMAWSILYPGAVFLFTQGASIATLMLLPKVSWSVWTTFQVIELTLLTLLVLENRGRPANRLLKAAVLLGAAGLVIGLLRIAALMGLPAIEGGFQVGIVVGLGFGLGLAFDLVLWFGLEQLLSEKLAPGIRGAFFALRLLATGLGLWAIRWMFTGEAPTHDLSGNPLFSQLGGMAISLGWNGLVAYLFFKVANGAASMVAPTGPQVSDATAGTDITIGAASLLAGIAVTAVSYSTASGGGRYVVTTGLIAFGLIRLGRGMKKAANR